MAGYDEIDSVIRSWAERHSLVLFTEFADREARFAYVSSNDSECFQISIQPPAGGRVAVAVQCVEGRRDLEVPNETVIALADLEATLDNVFEFVLDWMAPAERYFPK